MLADWIEGLVRAFEYIEGVTELVVPDNPRALIADPDRYEPQASATLLDLAAHYGTAVLPARPYKPKDKTKVEQAALVVERWILARAAAPALRHAQRGRPRGGRCRRTAASSPVTGPPRSTSTTTSCSTAITTACRTRSCRPRWLYQHNHTAAQYR